MGYSSPTYWVIMPFPFSRPLPFFHFAMISSLYSQKEKKSLG